MVAVSSLNSEKEVKDFRLSTEKYIYICHTSVEEFGKVTSYNENVDLFKKYFKALTKRLQLPDIKIYHSGLAEAQKKEAINKSEVFIILLDSFISPNFKKELKLIQNKFENSQDLLLIKFKTSPAITEGQAPFLLNIPSVDFYDDEYRRNHLYGNRERDDISQDKRGKLTELIYRVEKFYQNRKKENIHDGFKATVFLAETTSDQIANREIIKREIEQFGFRVLPKHQLPDEANEFKKAVEDDLKISDISIHIIGEDYGKIPQGEIHSFVDLQNKIAANVMRKYMNSDNKFKRMIWLSPDLKVSSELQKLYVEKLKRDYFGINDAEIMQIPLEAFKTSVISKLKSLAISETLTDLNKSEKNRTYVIHEKHDVDNIKPIADWLLENDFNPLLSPFTGNGNEILRNHRKYLVECDSVIVYISGYNHSWLNSKISDLLKAPGYGRKKPYSVKAVLINLDTNGLDKELLKDFLILHQNKNISYTMLPFLEQFKAKDERS